MARGRNTTQTKDVQSSFTTPKGTKLELINFKGKPYMMVAQRLRWFEEENERYDITTQHTQLDEEKATYRATIAIIEVEKDGKANIKRKASAIKSENQKDFNDYQEKAETGSIGRALAYLGYGTQFATQDFDEGERIVDAPQNTSPSSRSFPLETSPPEEGSPQEQEKEETSSSQEDTQKEETKDEGFNGFKKRDRRRRSTK